MKIQEYKQFGLSFLLMLHLLSTCSIASARLIQSSNYFTGKYKNKDVYGVLNTWDNRACTIVNDRAVIGRVNTGSKTVLFPDRKIKILGTMLMNPYRSSQIPPDLLKNSNFQVCLDKMLYAQCFIRAGVKYYKEEDEAFRGLTKTRTRMFSIGLSTSSRTRDDVHVDPWAYFSIKPDGNDFIVDYKQLVCPAN